MGQEKIAGIFLIIGFAFVIFATIAGPPRLYQEPEPAMRLQLIADHSTAWQASNWLFALAGAASAAGLLLFSMHLQGQANTWLIWGAGAAYGIGSVLWVFLVFGRMRNPEPYFSDYSFNTFSAALVALLVIGLLLYGLAFLQAGYPAWLGYGFAGGMLLIGLLALVFSGPFFSAFPPQVLYLFTLVGGIAMLRGP